MSAVSPASDVLVVGGGMVGAAIAAGLVRRGAAVTVLDGGDGDIRASRANFGLVWVQGKGASFPAYQRWTRLSSDLWPAFADALTERTDVPLHYRRPGGLAFCLGEAEFEEKRAAVRRMHNQLGDGSYEARVLDRSDLAALLPEARLGPEVSGACFCPQDGDVDPLGLISALHAAIVRDGGRIVRGATVESLRPDGAGFSAETAGGRYRAGRVVIAAGLGSTALGRRLGLDVPLRPERGQILVTERLAPMLPFPASGLRQTAEGTMTIGATKEEAGFDTATTVDGGAGMAARAIRIFPALAAATLVRTWAGLRILSPDGAPVYAQSERHPGAFLAACHSGVTLAAAHAEVVAAAVLAGALPADLAPFHHGRFAEGPGHVPQAA